MNTLKIGISPTLSGKHVVQGIESFNGIKLWISRVRESPVIPEFKFYYYDNESNPDKIKKIAEKLILEDNVDILLGPYSSSLTLEFLKVCKEHERVLWNFGGSSDDIHNFGYTNLISTITEASKYYHGVIDLISSNRNLTGNIAVVFAANSSFSKIVADGAMKYASLKGIAYSKFKFISGDKNFLKIANSIKSSSIKNILFVGTLQDDITFCKYLINFNHNFNLIATLAAAVNKFKDELGSNCENFISTSQWEPALNYNVNFGPLNSEFVADFNKQYGYIPDYPAAQAYNMGILLEFLITNSGSTEELELLHHAKLSAISTLYGEFKVDETGKQIGHKMLVTQWQKNNKKIIFPEKYADSEFKLK